MSNPDDRKTRPTVIPRRAAPVMTTNPGRPRSVIHPPRTAAPGTATPQQQATPQHQAASLLQPVSRQLETPRAPWITVAGGKGGVGKTMISVNLALLAARGGRRVLLVDFDPGLANVGVHLRMSPRYDLVDLASGRCAPRDALVEGPLGMQVLCGRSGDNYLATSGSHGEHNVRRALAAIEDAARFAGADLVIVDCGAGIGATVMQSAGRSAVTMCVTTPEPSALTDAYALIKMLHHEQPRAVPTVVMNNVRNRDEAMRIAGRLQEVTERFLGRRVSFAGWLRHDPALAAAVAQQRPAALEARGHSIEDLRAILAAGLSHLPARRTSTSPKPSTKPVVTRRMLAEVPTTGRKPGP